jgi:polar amino acid transport system permease protein
VTGSGPHAGLTVGEAGSPASPPAPLPVVKVRHPLSWLSAALLALLVGGLAVSIARNDLISWDVVGKYLFSGPILEGVKATLFLTVVGMALGIALGTVLAVMRLSRNPVAMSVSAGYIWLFRGTPQLVQLIFWFNLGLVFPKLSLGIPFTDIVFVDGTTNAIMTPLLAATLGLALNEAAYMAEIVRGGIIGVDDGQRDAAKAIGMTPLRTMRFVILPQAVPVVLPPTGNELIGMLKNTSLVTVIGYTELLNSARHIYSTNYKTIELLVVVSLWYLALTTLLTIGQHFVERHYSRTPGVVR